MLFRSYCTDTVSGAKYEILKVPAMGFCFYAAITYATSFYLFTIRMDANRDYDRERKCSITKKTIKIGTITQTTGINTRATSTTVNTEMKTVEYSDAIFAAKTSLFEYQHILQWKFRMLQQLCAERKGASPLDMLEEDIIATQNDKPLQADAEFMINYMKDSTWAPVQCIKIAANLTGRQIRVFEFVPETHITTHEIKGGTKAINRSIKPTDIDYYNGNPRIVMGRVVSSSHMMFTLDDKNYSTIRLLLRTSEDGKNNHFDLLIPVS